MFFNHLIKCFQEKCNLFCWQFPKMHVFLVHPRMSSLPHCQHWSFPVWDLISPSLFPLLVLVFMASFPCTLTLCPLPWHWLCGCLFCMLVEFATVVMVVGKEINKKAGNGKQIDKSRGGVKGKGKRQRVTVSSLTSPDKVIGNLSFHYWKRRFEGKGIAFFFFFFNGWAGENGKK